MNSRCSIALATLCTFLVAGCAGGGSGVPAGSAVNYSPSPNPTATFMPASIAVAIVLPTISGQSARKHPAYLSASTQSVTLQLISVNGVSVASQPASTIDTYPGASNCAAVAGTSTISCSGTVAAASGVCIFSVTTYAQPSGTGAILSTGTIGSDTTSNPTLRLDSNGSTSLSAIVASITLVLTPARVTLGAAQSMQLTLTAKDTAGAIIVGPGTFATPIQLAVIGDPKHAVSFAGGATNFPVASPGGSIAVRYDGDGTIGTHTLDVQAQTLGASPPVIADSPIIVLPSPTPPPTPTPQPTATPTPPSTFLYVLNGGGAAQQSITEYATSKSGNTPPNRVLTLATRTVGFTVYAPVSLAVDASGNVYVGYSAGFTDPGNEIDVYAPGASGSAPPIRRIQADPKTTQLNPQVIGVDGLGRVWTAVQSSVDNQSASVVSIGVYASGASGSIAPSHAWSFNTPALSFGSFPTLVEAAFDPLGNFYVVGQLSDVNGNPSAAGVFVAPASAANGGSLAAMRVIPADSVTTLSSPGGLALDASATVYVADTSTGNVDVFPAGPTGTTDIPPARAFSNAGLSGSITAPLAISGAALYAAEPQAPSLASFQTLARGPVAAQTTLAGSATGLQFPLAITVGPSLSGR